MNNKLHQVLGDWRSSATNVKARIYAETIESKNKKKRLPTYIKLTAAAAVLTVGVTGAFLMTSERATAPVPAVENNTDPTKQQEIAFRPINETFLKIAQYELFYRDSFMYTQGGAVSATLRYGIEYFALFNHLAEHGLYWDEKKRDTYRIRVVNALGHDLKDAHFASYFENMLKELSITKEQYIDDYLLVKKEHEMLYKEMFGTGVGLNEGAYESGIEEDEFEKKIGLSFDYVEYLAVSSDERLTPLDPQPVLSFNQNPDDIYRAKVTKNVDGEYIFVNSELSRMDQPTAIRDYLRELIYKKQLSEFTRFSYPQVKAFVIQDAAAGIEIAQQTLDYFTIFERSIDWELTVQPYAFNEIPTFQEEGLRVHNDLTLKIAEYELYYKDESIYDRDVAYRFANELVANIYGLFNYLAQDHRYGWSAEIRAQHYTTLAKELEASMQNELEKTYVENLLHELNITKDEYIQYYLLPKKEYELLQQSMLNDQVGIDKNGRYNPGKQASRYRETVGLTWQDLFSTIWSISNTPAMKALDTQPDLPFPTNPKDPITVGLDENGEYIMEYPSILEIMLTDEQKALFEEIRKKHNLPPLARYSVKAYLEQAQLRSTKTAKELVDILIIFDRTIN